MPDSHPEKCLYSVLRELDEAFRGHPGHIDRLPAQYDHLVNTYESLKGEDDGVAVCGNVCPYAVKVEFTPDLNDPFYFEETTGTPICRTDNSSGS